MYDVIVIGAGSLAVRDQAMLTLNLRSVFIGILATITMDVLSGAAYKLRLITPLPPHLIGRWVASVLQGQLFHRDIGQVSPIKREMMIAVSAHYGIGVTLALAYLFASSALGLTPRNPITALGFALCTNLLPWLLMFPAMGYGWFGTQAPAGTRLFRSSFVTHCFYGVGLCLGASSLSSSANDYSPRSRPAELGSDSVKELSKMTVSSQNLENSLINFDGNVDPRFKEVLEVFVDNFEHQELGAAVAVYYRGELVVDLAAGLRDRVSRAPYSRGTLQPIFSVTKGITALAANMLADRRHLDLDAPVASYWPEFAQADKSGIPVRWLLTHQSGVLGLDRTISLAQLLDWNLVVDSLAVQAPDWKPGSNHGNHAISFGFLVGEVIRRVTGQTVGQYVSREIVGPLHADLFIGLPKGEVHRVAPALLPELGPGHTRLADAGPYAARVSNWISPALNPMDVNRPEVREGQIPAANGIANARSLARIFAASIGRVDGVRCLRKQAMYRARFERWRGLDVVMGVQNAMGLGFLLPTEWCPLGGPGSFGAAGFGGSRAWANPELELAFAYTPNLCSVGHFDPREAALSRTAVICAKHLCQAIQRNRRSRS